MYQSTRNNYKTNSSIGKSFLNSCLGRIIIAAAVLVMLLMLAHCTVPNEARMKQVTMDNIRQCLEEGDSVKNVDWVDDFVSNIGYFMTNADSTVNEEQMRQFNKLNNVEYYRHSFYSTAYIHNNLHLSGARVSIGVFGLVIPTLRYSDILLNLGPIRQQKKREMLIEINTDAYDPGENPTLTPYHYKGNPND